MFYFIASVGDQKLNLEYQINVLSFYRSKLLFESEQIQIFTTKFHILNYVQCPSFEPIERQGNMFYPFDCRKTSKTKTLSFL